MELSVTSGFFMAFVSPTVRSSTVKTDFANGPGSQTSKTCAEDDEKWKNKGACRDSPTICLALNGWGSMLFNSLWKKTLLSSLCREIQKKADIFLNTLYISLNWAKHSGATDYTKSCGLSLKKNRFLRVVGTKPAEWYCRTQNMLTSFC